MGRKFRVFGAFEKVEAQEDGSLVVSGIASSETVDGAGEVVKAAAMEEAIPAYMKFGAVREMHQPIAAGTALSISVVDGVTKFEAHVVDVGSVAKVHAGVLKGFSIGGTVTSRDTLNKKIIDGLKLTEISLVDVPCNPDAVFAIAKFDNPEESEMDNETAPETVAPIKKGMWSVQDFASILMSIGWMAQDAKWESENEGDASAVPGKLAAWLSAGAEIFQEMAAEEVSELLATLKPKGAVEAITMAADTTDLNKAGSKFSKATKDNLEALHKAAMDSHKETSKCMKALGAAWQEEDKDDTSDDGKGEAKDPPVKKEDAEKAAESEAITKAAGLADELAKATAATESLQKAFDAQAADLTKAKADLDAAECKLKTKGSTQAVTIEKGSESKSLTSGAADAPDLTDPMAAMKAAQAMPMSVLFNRPAHQG